MTSRRFVITINNPTDEDLKNFQNDELFYSIYQLERGNGGTLHAQGFLQYKNPKRIAGVSRLFPRAHIEIARGNIEHNINYCSKEAGRVSGPFEFGTKPPGQGTRTDLIKLKQDLLNGKSDIEILDDHIILVAKFPKFISFVRSCVVAPRSDKPTVTCLWGPSGSGKTRTAIGDQYQMAYVVSRPDNGRPLWWDGYTGQPRVVIDDFYGWIPWSFLLQLLDRYPFMVEIKGGKIHFNSKEIYITSNTEPKSWYKNIPNNDLTPLLRRIDEIKYMI